MCVGKDKRIYENDAKCTCYDYYPSFGIMQKKICIDVRQEVTILILMGSAFLLFPVETCT